MSVERIAAAAAPATVDPTESKPTADKAAVAKLAAEFESLLLANVLRDMRSAGRWSSDEDSPDSLGGGAFGQTFDTELARNLSQAGGFGLAGWLQKALDRYAPSSAAASPIATQAAALANLPPAAIAAQTSALADLAPMAIAVPQCTVPTPAAPGATPVASTPSEADGLQRPTARLTSGFGWRKDPLTGAASFHRGVDLKAAEGEPVGATGAGRVVFSGQNGGYGTSVVIEHANGLRTRYAHLSTALVNVGDQVSEGQPIGLAGHTGRATGPHVHYEVLAQGRAVDPLQ